MKRTTFAQCDPPVRTRLLGKEFVKYFAASLVALAVDVVVFSVSIRIAGMPWYWAATAGFFAGVATAYCLSVLWVFSRRRLRREPMVEFVVFAGIGLAGLGLTQAILWVGIEHLHFTPELVKLFASGATFLFNFVIRKAMLFAGTGGGSA